jgi:hypothetical protein
MKKINILKKTDGTTTLEFAIIFPLVFFITFFSLLFLFWISDSMITTYEASRINRLESVGVSMVSTDTVYQKLAKIPTVNVFTKTTVLEEIVIDSNLTLLRTTMTSTQPSVTPFIIQLILAGPGQINKSIFQTLTSTSYSVKEPYIIATP